MYKIFMVDDDLEVLEINKKFFEDKNCKVEVCSRSKEALKMIEKFKDCTIKGMTIAASGFYGPQGRVIRMPLAMPDMLDTFESFRFGDEKVTNFEMEGSAIAGIAAHLGHNAGTVCCIIAHRHHKASNPDYKAQVRKLIELALDKLAE